ncbi:MAG: gluconate 2-dehydrogenase subunit 3 family protein [Chitinophagia bacterium]|nr:gluconate 2-dehydrogenase subunit 3 family protein [Chitinophagia bacterium]
MNRREAISSVTLLLGGTLLGAEAFLSGCKNPAADSSFSFSATDISFLNEVAETILPATSTPGAKEKTSGKSFMEATPEQRHDLLVALDKEQKEYQSKKKPEDPTHYFRMMKELTLWGYFTSEIGATKALRYVAVPGKYEGCIPYKKGDKAWAT